MRLLISGGGTGGHVYPALAVVDSLFANSVSPVANDVSRASDAQAAGDKRSATLALPARASVSDMRDAICWIGSEGGVEQELVKRAGLPFEAIPAGGLHGLAAWSAARNLVRLARGLVKAFKLVADWKPQVLFVTGGFVSVPVALACWARRIPILVYLPDIEPGQAIRFLSRFATRIAVTAEGSRRYLPASKVVVTGYPVRKELIQARVAKADALARLDLDTTCKTILVFGGSKGARSLNRALSKVLDQVLDRWQVIHISGTLDAAEAQARREMLSDERKSRYKLFAYLHGEEMGLALAAADLAVSRAGASILGEFPLMGLPAILVPYPFAWRYQRGNADSLVERGAAVRLDDEALGQELLPTLESVLGDETRLEAMQTRMRTLANTNASATLARELVRLAGKMP